MIKAKYSLTVSRTLKMISLNFYTSKLVTFSFVLFRILPEVSCSIPAGIPNGFITFAVMRQHGYKEKVKYGCNEHYILEGEAEVQCQNTGTWSLRPMCRGESWGNEILKAKFDQFVFCYFQRFWIDLCWKT